MLQPAENSGRIKRRLKDHPRLISATVEEVLRFQSPLQIGNRLATQDIELPSGPTIARGIYIHTSIAGANRDPDVFENPEIMDFSRSPNRHLAFATGIHICLGAALARIEGRIAIGRLVERFRDVQAAGEREIMPLARFRGFYRLGVRV